MAQPALLDEQAFLATFRAPMADVTDDGGADLDIWSYVDQIDATAIGIGSVRDVDRVYRSGDGAYDHVLIATDRADVLLAIVVDLAAATIHGHHVLDLSERYGLR